MSMHTDTCGNVLRDNFREKVRLETHSFQKCSVVILKSFIVIGESE